MDFLTINRGNHTIHGRECKYKRMNVRKKNNPKATIARYGSSVCYGVNSKAKLFVTKYIVTSHLPLS